MTRLLVSLGLIVFNGFFVLAEFALVKVRASRIEELARKGSLSAARVRSISRNIDAYLSATQLGITMSSLGLGWIGEPVAAQLIEPLFEVLPVALTKATSYTLSFGFAFVVITFLHVVAGELTPKYMALRSPTRSALFVSGPLDVFYRLVYAPMAVLHSAAHGLLRLLGFTSSEEADVAHSEEEFKILLSYSQERGALSLSRLLLFENLFDFGNTSVKDVMTPAGAVAFLSTERPWKENLALIRARKHTRYPLCGAGLDDVKGAVHLMDIVLSGQWESPDLLSLKREVPFLPESAPLEKALAELRKRGLHLALVRSKAGQVAGLITLEDVLEELIGEVRDEFEAPPPDSLTEAVVPEAVEMNLAQQDKAEALRWMLQKLAAARPELDFKEAWDVVWRREMALTSAVGGGVALPHGRLEGLSKPLVALGRSPEGIPFDALDKKPVRLIFLILTPLKEPTAQLRLLAKVAAFASHDAFRRNLGRAKTPREALDILAAFDQSVTE